MSKEISETFFACGHANVLATHRSTVEFTKETHLSRTGDCIVAVGAEKGLMDLTHEFKDSLHKPNAKLTIIIEADGLIEQIHANGAANLLLTHPSDMVVRKSIHVDSRTLAINADKSAGNLNRTLVNRLQNPKQKVKVTLNLQF